MPSLEQPDAQFDRLKRKLQDSILTDYPNPERKGCVGDAVLKELAARPFDSSMERDPHWQHVTHCSECYRDFLRFRAEVRRSSKARLTKIGLASSFAAVLIAAGALLAIRESTRPKRPQIAELVFRHRDVDFEVRATTRSEEGKGETKPLVLEREPEELAIRLPFGSRAGSYEVQIVTSAGHPLLSAAGEAKIENGTTAVTVKLDLAKLESGNYFICIRRVPGDWTCSPVVIR
jgi:hypothetical protein